MISDRPTLEKTINIDAFKNFYWLKSELIKFCNQHGLAMSGGKLALAERIELFITTGKKVNSKTKHIQTRDSKKIIMRNTPVLHYKNDAATREFFVKQIGDRFHFTAYLRQFTNKNNTVNKNLTYGDLVDGWLAEEAVKKDPNYKSTIGDQFEYNRFTRDFFANEKGKTRADAIKAWKIVKAARGTNTYAYYKILSLK